MSASWGKVSAVLALLEAIVGALLSAFRSRANLVAENLVLRQQLAVWVVVSRVWSRWVDVLAIVKPAPSLPGIGVATPRSGLTSRRDWDARRLRSRLSS
jgi:hypothetical protein